MVQNLAPDIEAIAAELLADIEDEMEVVSQLAFPLPVIVIARGPRPSRGKHCHRGDARLLARLGARRAGMGAIHNEAVTSNPDSTCTHRSVLMKVDSKTSGT